MNNECVYLVDYLAISLRSTHPGLSQQLTELTREEHDDALEFWIVCLLDRRSSELPGREAPAYAAPPAEP